MTDVKNEAVLKAKLKEDGFTLSNAGYKISLNSAGNITRTGREINQDSEPEDDFGYTTKKIAKKYSNLGEVFLLTLPKSQCNFKQEILGDKGIDFFLGFIQTIDPTGKIVNSGQFGFADEILEINGQVITDSSCKNLYWMLHRVQGSNIKIIVKRSSTEDDSKVFTVNEYGYYKSLRNEKIPKDSLKSCDIILAEDQHPEIGQCISIPSIKAQSPILKNTGIQIGDFVVAINCQNVRRFPLKKLNDLIERCDNTVTLTLFESTRIPVVSPLRSKSPLKEQVVLQTPKPMEESEEISIPGSSREQFNIASDVFPKKIIPTERTIRLQLGTKSSYKKEEVSQPPKPKEESRDISIPGPSREQSEIDFQKRKNELLRMTAPGASDIASGVLPKKIIPTERPIRLQLGSKSSYKKEEVLQSQSPREESKTFSKKEPSIEMNVEFQKKRNEPLGITISGGSNTPSKRIFILEIHNGGVAHKTGELRCGDEILKFGKDHFTDIKQNKARDIVSKSSKKITMLIRRNNSFIQEIHTELPKASNKSAGIELESFSNGLGAYISRLEKGNEAMKNQILAKGDRILTINSEDMSKKSAQEITKIMKAAGRLNLKVSRYMPCQ